MNEEPHEEKNSHSWVGWQYPHQQQMCCLERVLLSCRNMADLSKPNFSLLTSTTISIELLLAAHILTLQFGNVATRFWLWPSRKFISQVISEGQPDEGSRALSRAMLTGHLPIARNMHQSFLLEICRKQQQKTVSQSLRKKIPSWIQHMNWGRIPMFRNCFTRSLTSPRPSGGLSALIAEISKQGIVPSWRLESNKNMLWSMGW